jgi:MFS family permease
MLFGSLIAGPTANMIGRKWTTIFGTCGMLALGYALVAAAQYVWMMLLGRFLHGVGLGFSTTVSTLYIMEVTTPNMRGSLAVVPAIAGTLGLLTTQVLGAWLNWQWLSIVCASLNVPFFLMLIFIPESPVYLISTEQIDAAHKILRVLRGPKWDVTKELTDIKVASEGRETYHVRLQDFFTSVVLKPFLIALTLMFFFQFSGINVILQYTVDIFKLADISVDIFLVISNYYYSTFSSAAK